MRIVADYVRLAALTLHHVEYNRPFEIAAVASQGYSHSRLTIQFSLPHANPLFVVLGFRTGHQRRGQCSDSQHKGSESHHSSSIAVRTL